VEKEYFKKIEPEIKTIESYYKCNVKNINNFEKIKYSALITVGDLNKRKELLNFLPSNTEHYTYIDKNVIIMDKNNCIGMGSIICAGSILTTNVIIGNFSQINLNTTISHDFKAGNFFTTAPGVNIAGYCNFGNNVYIGTNACVKNNVNICDNVIIGLNAGVVKNITESGTYIGTPAKKLI
jgi:sugar O-acyltransferase (sialic acid O-acetyltransferase NeuD family)